MSRTQQYVATIPSRLKTKGRRFLGRGGVGHRPRIDCRRKNTQWVYLEEIASTEGTEPLPCNPR